MRIHPIPPGLWCVPSALVAITGEPWDAVIHPALNRHSGHAIGDMVVASTESAAVATLLELGYRVMRYTKDMKASYVSTWARRSTEIYPGQTILCWMPRHVVVVRDGLVYDSWMPHGAPGATHPYHDAPVHAAYVVQERR